MKKPVCSPITALHCTSPPGTHSTASEGCCCSDTCAGSHPSFVYEKSQPHKPPRKRSKDLSRCWLYQQMDSIVMAILMIKLQCRKEGMCTHHHLHVLRAFMPGSTSLPSLFSLNEPEIQWSYTTGESLLCIAELSWMILTEHRSDIGVI